MSYGISIKNTNGYVIADDTYKNYSIISTQTVNLGTLTAFGSQRRLNITDRGTVPMVFIRLSRSTGFISLLRAERTYLDFMGFNSSKSLATITFDLMLTYPLPAASSPGSTGISIYDSSGQKTFDSRWIVPRVKAICTGSTITGPLGKETIIYHGQNLNNPWICLSTLCGTRGSVTGGLGGQPPSYFLGWAIANHDNNNIVYVTVPVGAIPQEIPTELSPQPFNSLVLAN